MLRLFREAKVSGEGDEEAKPSRRRSKRLDVQTDAVVSNVFGASSIGKVIDVSAHGCQIELRSGELRFGQFVSLRVGKLEPWIEMVRRADANVYGIEFAQSVCEPVIELLASKQPMVELS